ncbi:cytochrome P450 [Sphaerisporangium melleum]|uniref:Cytochrome P450 n=1 Tax=Sphaerisporangium melleum TaxID=321316 RepID=A0A917R0T2_9ACTN|nr:cytochrome P450 [Sphaerisporangium melleum]GGK81909.1 cytochrome P450 [Sphaerisporangium melleum]GII73787.1 cytochrome P450 [Sphaerisporangium melleum]
MTHPPSPNGAGRCPIFGVDRTPLYDEAFHSDPAAVFRHLRDTEGPVAKVWLEPGVPGYIIVDHQTMLEVSRDDTWSHDSRLWREWRTGRIPDHSELVPMMMWRPNLLFADGSDHTRLRRAVADSLAEIDLRAMEADIATIANDLIGAFAAQGTADLIAQYAVQLPLLAFNRLFGLDDRAGRALVGILRRIWDGSDAVRANTELERMMGRLIGTKRRTPGRDLTTSLIKHHAALDDEELIHHLVVIIGAGNTPVADLIGNTLRMILTDRQAGTNVAGLRDHLTIPEVIHRVLWLDTPMAVYPWVYPRRDTRLGNVIIPAGSAVGMALAAANLSVAEQRNGALLRGNRAYTSFGVGPHKCPADELALRIAGIGVQTVLHRLPELRLAVHAPALGWRRSVFARALTALPVQFTPLDHQSFREGTWNPSSSTPTPTSTIRPRRSASSGPWSLSNFRARWRRGR